MLKKSVPPFVAQMREMAELFGAEQPELDRLEGILTELLAQFYIKTATYSLNQWEQDFGIAENPELTQEQRRAAARRRNLSRSPRSAMLPAVPPQPLHRNRRARRGAPRSQPPAAG